MVEAAVTLGCKRETVALLYSESSSRNHISWLDDLNSTRRERSRVRRRDSSEQVMAVIFKLLKASQVGEGLYGLQVMPKVRAKTQV